MSGYFAGLGGARKEPSEAEAAYSPRIDSQPAKVVVVLGAGASAPFGCPLIRGFIDRARDLSNERALGDDVHSDLDSALRLYDDLHQKLRYTEEDLENIENLLSFAELSALVKNSPMTPPLGGSLTGQFRRFIDTILSYSMYVPPSGSHQWLGIGGESGLRLGKPLVRALAELGDRVAVITLNYDCILEHCCYSMGLPFTYGRAEGTQLEILKLHGSTNWMTCEGADCGVVKCVPMEQVARPEDPGWGRLRRSHGTCSRCGGEMVPVIVPPGFNKSFASTVLRAAWSRAAEVLGEAEALVAVGYSLPESDAHFRHLLHLGLASGRLRQAVAIVGSDLEAAARWRSVFRESWGRHRLEVRMAKAERITGAVLLPAMCVRRTLGEAQHEELLPVGIGDDRLEEMAKSFHKNVTGVGGYNIVHVLMKLRLGQAVEFGTDCTATMRHAAKESGLDWSPSGQMLPVEGMAEWPAS